MESAAQPGLLLGLPYQVWTYGLGVAALGTGWTITRLGTRFFPTMPWLGPLVGLFCVFEWHLVWASVSGMETILYVWLSVLLVELWFVAGGRSKVTAAKQQSAGASGGTESKQEKKKKDEKVVDADYKVEDEK